MSHTTQPLGVILLTLLVLAGLGCATSGAPVESDLAIPAEWTAAPSRSPKTETKVANWWQEFGDSDLDRLIDLALASNRDLRSAAARLDAALAQARIAGSGRKPQSSLSTSGARRKQNFIGLPIPGAGGAVLSNTSTALGASLDVSWEVDLWGRIRDTSRSARARAEAAAFEFEAARLSISGQTAKAWFALLEAKNQVALAQDTRDNRTGVRERIERRYRQGLRSALDLRLAVTNEANTEARLAARRRQQDAVERQLQVLLGRDADAMTILDQADPSLPTLPAIPNPNLPSEVLRRRPDIQASEHRLAAAGLDVAAARKLLYPRLTLTGSTGRSSTELDDLLDSDFSVWSLAAGLLQPLFQGGRLKAGVALAEAGQMDVLAQHENAVIRAVTDVEAQLASDAFLSDQQRSVERAKNASSAAQELAQERYFSGLSDYLSVLAAQGQATTAASQLLEINRLRLEQRVDLYLALGGSLAGTESAAGSRADLPNVNPSEVSELSEPARLSDLAEGAEPAESEE